MRLILLDKDLLTKIARAMYDGDNVIMNTNERNYSPVWRVTIDRKNLREDFHWIVGNSNYFYPTTFGLWMFPWISPLTVLIHTATQRSPVNNLNNRNGKQDVDKLLKISTQEILHRIILTPLAYNKLEERLI